MAAPSPLTPSTTRIRRRAWFPLGFIVVSLLLLLVTPFVVNNRVRELREKKVDVSDQGRLVLSDLQEEFATELITLWTGSSDTLWADSVRAATVARERLHESELDTLVMRLGPEARKRFAALSLAEQRWRDANRGAVRSTVLVRGPNAAEAHGVLVAAEELHDYLFNVSTQSRLEVRAIEVINLYSAAVLGPIALIAVGVVFRLDRKMRLFAYQAHDRAQRLERSIERRATLIRGVTHDIKNPLGAASGYADLLEEKVPGPINDQQMDMVQRIKRLVGRALKTVAELVDLAQVDAGELPIEWRETDLLEVAHAVVDDYAARATQKRLSLSLDAPASAVSITTDPTHVRHILDNLVSNAIKYTPVGGSVSVGVSMPSREGDDAPRARVTVTDTGQGIPLVFHERIFDEFFRVPSTENGIPGTGLGLSISRRIARLLGGDVTVADAPVHGTIFTLALPPSPPHGARNRRHGDSLTS